MACIAATDDEEFTISAERLKNEIPTNFLKKSYPIHGKRGIPIYQIDTVQNTGHSKGALIAEKAHSFIIRLVLIQ